MLSAGGVKQHKTLFKASHCRALFFISGDAQDERADVKFIAHNDHINDQISGSLEKFEVKAVVQKKKKIDSKY